MERISKHSINSDLQELKKPLKKDLENGQEKKPSGDFTPPDGGWGWVVCLTSMLCNGTVFSIMNTFGILYTFLLKEFAQGDSEISFKTSFVGSVSTGLTFLMSIVSSILSDRVGIRPTAFAGALFGLVGLISSAFVEQLELLYLTFGVCLGIGAGLLYSPSLVILGHYFNRHMGLVNGIVAFGSSLYTIILSIALPYMLITIKIKYTFIVLAVMYLLLAFCTLTWIPQIPKQSSLSALTLSKESLAEHVNDCCAFTRKFMNTNIFKNKAYVIWALSLGVALFGYFVPFVHLVKHTNDVFPEENGSFLITCTQITSAIGRLVFGKIADLPCMNRLVMQQVAFVVMGIVTACIPFSGSYGGLIAISLILGISDGVFVCLIGPIAFDIVGQYQASQAIGFLLGIFAIPFTVGPPVAGFLYDSMGSYTIAFHAAGAPPIIGAIIMFFIPKVKQHYPAATEAETFASISLLDVHHVSSQHFRDTMQKLNQNSGGGPSSTELEVINANDIFLGEKNTRRPEHVTISEIPVEIGSENESREEEQRLLPTESEEKENQTHVTDENSTENKDNTHEKIDEVDEKQKLLQSDSHTDLKNDNNSLKGEVLKTIGISEA